MDLEAFTLWNYTVSWLEIAGFITGLVAIYLAGRGKVATFFVGLFNCIIYFVLFWQQGLYSLMLLQVIFFGIDIYGIVAWGIPKKKKHAKKLYISMLQPQNQVGLGLGILFGGLVWGWIMESITNHFDWEVSKYLYTDAIVFVANVVGQILLTRKKIENWPIWVLADIASVILCLLTNMYLSAILYLAYIAIAFYSWYQWHKEMDEEAQMLAKNAKSKKK